LYLRTKNRDRRIALRNSSLVLCLGVCGCRSHWPVLNSDYSEYNLLTCTFRLACLCSEIGRNTGRPREQSSWLAWHIARLLVIRKGFCCGTRSFALGSFFVLFTSLFLAACARCPFSFSPISTVVRLECHEKSSLPRLISFETIHKYGADRILPAFSEARIGDVSIWLGNRERVLLLNPCCSMSFMRTVRSGPTGGYQVRY
jgi:hypothetical protein